MKIAWKEHIMFNETSYTHLNRLFYKYARKAGADMADDIVSVMWEGLMTLKRSDPERLETLLRQQPTYILKHCAGHYAQPYLKVELRRQVETLRDTIGGESFLGASIRIRRPGTRQMPNARTFNLTEEEWRTHLNNLWTGTEWHGPAIEPLDLEAWLATLHPLVADAAVLLLCGFTDEELGWHGRQAKAALRRMWKQQRGKL